MDRFGLFANGVVFYDQLFRVLEMQASACQVALLETFNLFSIPNTQSNASIQQRVGQNTERRARRTQRFEIGLSGDLSQSVKKHEL